MSEMEQLKQRIAALESKLAAKKAEDKDEECEETKLASEIEALEKRLAADDDVHPEVESAGIVRGAGGTVMPGIDGLVRLPTDRTDQQTEDGRPLGDLRPLRGSQLRQELFCRRRVVRVLGTRAIDEPIVPKNHLGLSGSDLGAAVEGGECRDFSSQRRFSLGAHQFVVEPVRGSVARVLGRIVA